MPYSEQKNNLNLVKAVGTFLTANGIVITTPEGKALEDIQKLLSAIVEGWAKPKRTDRVTTVRCAILRSENPDLREISAEDLVGFLERVLAA